ncbi:outer membrane protein transport protein [bacterium]|nr:outer membrane protein transport protein [bacterium]
MVKKRRRITLLMSAFLFIQAGFCWGGGFEGPGLGIRANSMGGAFIAMADDWTAGYWNPAGLAQLEGTGMGIVVDCVTVIGKDGNSIANGSILDPNYPDENQGDIFYQVPPGVEPLQFDKKDITVISYLPGIGVYKEIKGYFTIEASIYEPIGYSSKWKDMVGGVDGVNAFYEETFYTVVYNTSLARKMSSKLLLGAGLNILQGKWEKEARKTTLDYNCKSGMDGDGTGYEGVFGFLYSLPWDKMKLGGVYRTGSEISLEGKGFVEDLRLGIDERTNYTQKFNYPATYGIGIIGNPLRKLTLSFDWQATDWTKIKRDIDFDNDSGAAFVDFDENLKWEKTERIRIGGEYNFDKNFAARIGFYTDPTPVPDEQVSLTNVLDVDRNNITFGGGYSEKDWQVDIGYIYGWGSKTINEVRYKKEVGSFQVAFSYLF